MADDKAAHELRIDEMFTKGRALRTQGASHADILSNLWGMNEGCDCPLNDEEIVKVARRVCDRYAPGSDAQPREEAGVMFELPVITDAEIEAMDATELVGYRTLSYIYHGEDGTVHTRRARFKARTIKLKLSREFSSACSDYERREAQERIARQRSTSSVEIRVDGIPLSGLYIEDWTVDELGACRPKRVGKIEFTEWACHHPIIVSARIVDVDTSEERVRVAWRNGEHWCSMAVERATIASRQAIVAPFANMGVGVTTENAGVLVQYLGDLLAQNVGVIPIHRGVSRLGWINVEHEFAPYTADVQYDGEQANRAYYESVHERGSFNEWLKIIKEKRASLPFRALMAAAYAAPLTKRTGSQSFCVHLFGKTSLGKTVSLNAAASIWGACDTIVTPLNSTPVGLEFRAAFFHSLPLCLDELQSVGSGKDGDARMHKRTIQALVYTLTGGKSKSRGTKEGGMRAEAHWNTTILTTGEEPITDEHTPAGEVARILELELVEDIFRDGVEASAFMDAIRSNYGHAGRKYITAMIDAAQITDAYAFYRALVQRSSGIAAKQANACALLLTAERLACRHIYGMDELESDGAVMELFRFLLAHLRTVEEVDAASRAYTWMRGWVAVNRPAFITTTPPRFSMTAFDADDEKDPIGTHVFGKLEKDRWLINRNSLDDALAAAGYNPHMVTTEWQRRGWTEGEQASGRHKARPYKIVCIKGMDRMCYIIPLAGGPESERDREPGEDG